MQRFIYSHGDSFQKNSNELTLGFTWGDAGPLPTPIASASPTPNPIPSPSPSPGFLSSTVDYLVNQNLIAGIIVAIVIIFVLFLLVYFVPRLWEGVREQIRVSRMRRGQSRRKGQKGSGSHRKPRSDLDEIDLPTSGQGGRENEVASAQRVLAERQRSMGAGAYPPAKTLTPAVVPRQDGRLTEVESKIANLEGLINQKANRDEGLTRAAEQSVVRMLQDQQRSIRLEMDATRRQILNNDLKALEDLLHQHADSVRIANEKTAGNLDRMRTDQQNVRAKLDEVLTEMRVIGDRLNLRIKEFEEKLDSQTEPDSFYAKTLGVVLGQNVAALQEGNFERLIGDRLNQFFQTGVDRGDR